MKTVKFYWEFKMSDEVFKSKNIQELINAVKSGQFQREMEREDKVNKCIATVEVL